MKSTFKAELEKHFRKLRRKYKSVASLHEGESLLREEFTEFVKEVHAKPAFRDIDNMRKELIHLASLCRIIHEDAFKL